MQETNQRVAVITGAANGLGLALTRLCLQKQMTVVMADLDESGLEKRALDLAKEYNQKILPIVCDVSNIDDVNNLASKTYAAYSRVDWLINNAGIVGPVAPLWELDVSKVQRVMDINLMGAVHTSKVFLPKMFMRNTRSHLINISSLYALCSGSQLAPYSMSKHALLALSESLYFDLKRLDKPVDVSIVFPSFINTKLFDNPDPDNQSPLESRLKKLLSSSREALEIADYIIKEIEKKSFYILPDKEVKTYCETRLEAVIYQQEPYIHSLEKLMVSLSNRTRATK